MTNEPRYFDNDTDEFFPAMTLPPHLLNIHLLRAHCDDHHIRIYDAFLDSLDSVPPLHDCIERHIRSLLGTDHPTDSTYQDLLDDINDYDLHTTALTN